MVTDNALETKDLTVERKEEKEEKKQPAKRLQDVVVLEYFDEDDEADEATIQAEIEDALSKLAVHGTAIISVPRQFDTGTMKIWLTELGTLDIMSLNVNSNLHIKNHDSRKRGGWVCYRKS